jgi:hypothetical protein
LQSNPHLGLDLGQCKFSLRDSPPRPHTLTTLHTVTSTTTNLKLDTLENTKTTREQSSCNNHHTQDHISTSAGDFHQKTFPGKVAELVMAPG